MNVNAAYVLFYKNTPHKLLDACQDLGFVGLNTAGFESDSEFSKLITNFDRSSKLVGHIGYLKYEEDNYKAYYQGGEGLFQAILKKFDIDNKELVIVGAGNVATSLIDTIALKNKKPKKITIVNRTYERAKALTEKLSNIDNIQTLSELGNISGDILVNATPLGGGATDDVFNENIVSKYKGVVDVTFETENTNLTTLAKKLNIVCSSGWDFFTFQGKVFLENVLEIDINEEVLKKHVSNGLKTIV